MKTVIQMLLLLSVLMAPIQKAQSALIFTQNFGLVVFSAAAGFLAGNGFERQSNSIMVMGGVLFVLGEAESKKVMNTIDIKCWKNRQAKKHFHELSLREDVNGLYENGEFSLSVGDDQVDLSQYLMSSCYRTDPTTKSSYYIKPSVPNFNKQTKFLKI
ncbi:MAG: hypothetical protein QE271_07705 [Bacteriovoracaceae bacterium]|nr:hypothetical protein [Bacteriovoracaceae bacterium]